MEVWLRRRRRWLRFIDFRFEAAAATLSATGSASPRPDRSSWLGGLRRALSPAFRAGLYPLIPWRVGAEQAGAAKNGSMASGAPSLVGVSLFPVRGGGRDARSDGLSFATTRSQQLAGGATACSLSGISGWSLSLNPVARGGRTSWRGEEWKYGFGGAVAG